MPIRTDQTALVTGNHTYTHGARAVPWLKAVAIPVTPQEGLKVPFSESVHRLEELALEREPSQLAIRNDLAAGLLLESHDVIDRAVLGSFKRVGSDRAMCEGLSGVQECPGPKQAPDVVGVHAAHH